MNIIINTINIININTYKYAYRILNLIIEALFTYCFSLTEFEDMVLIKYNGGEEVYFNRSNKKIYNKYKLLHL